MVRIAILGAGCLGKQAIEIIAEQKMYKPIGFFDDIINEAVGDLPIIGKTQDVFTAYAENKFDKLFIAIGYKHLDKKYKLIRNELKDIPLATIIHPSAYIDKDVLIEEGVLIYPNVFIGRGSKVCKGAIINVGVIFPHDNIIESCTFVSVAVVSGGNTKIGKRGFIGLGSHLGDGLSISDDVIIGVGSTVITNIFESGTYVGCPVRKIK